MNSIYNNDMKLIYEEVHDQIHEMKDSTILITGFAGFIGYYLTSFLARYAESLNISLILIDNYTIRLPEWYKEIENNPHCFVYNIDVEDIDESVIANLQDVSYIVHMASIASPVYYRKYPLETINANVKGLECLGQLFISGKLPNLKRLIYLSSSEIYGNPDNENVPTDESYEGRVNCIGPRACYDESKRICETLCWVYINHYSMPISVIRPFNVYGPGMSIYDKRLPADLAKSIMEGKDIVLYSDGSPTRTFCYITDAISGMLKVLLLKENDIFNIGNDFPEVTVEKMARLYKEKGYEICSYKGEIRYITHSDEEYLVNNPERRCPNISKIKIKVGYNPKISLEEGISRYLLFLREELK